MKYKCDHKGFDRKKIVDNIEKHDCHVVMVIGDHLPGFVYSIGLYEKFGHPEIICFGLNLDMMGSLVNEVRNWIKENGKIEPYLSYPDFLMNADVKFIPVEATYFDDYFNFGINYYKENNFPAMQMVWPDKENKFPWEDDFFKDWMFKQPLLDRNTGFKFYEDPKLGVYTTKQAFEGDPILYVYHNEDGDWQFHTSDNPDLDDAKLVCFEEIVKLDNSINELFNLGSGCSAYRETSADEWEITED